ncbi:GDSL-type esterase/lipase family protein [Methylobacterium sp. NEAU 140]|uniref:GDSL-type esterase/lipase family protein n=1 Tax=Methylobacterium sp. NEAU 140 TaxID=3064945 RepID=UPI00273263D8|nr:GDSL-type esterase/lipase family protein [Methylobacterium sp. NEAU 140]MDP4023888.1 GDSL-type esterase/lipase family protein [Methylobacterium sp. NEAU 140]
MQIHPFAQDPMTYPLCPTIFVGDDITERWAALRPDLFRVPTGLARGISGQTMHDMALRIRSEIAASDAKGLHLLCGFNEFARGEASIAAIVNQIAAILTAARDLYVVAFVGAIPPAGRRWQPGAEHIAVTVNAWLRDHARDTGGRYIDYYGTLLGEGGHLRAEYAAPDGGLSPAGYAAIEPVMRNALTAPGLEPIHAPAETDEEASRRKFLRHFGHLDSNTRLPRPFIQFAGKPGSSHYGVPFDAHGFLNATAVTHEKPAGETRVFVVGDSTIIDGGDLISTLPGRMERVLRAEGLPGAKVFNFGVMSSCLTQMAHLVWSHLLEYRPDAIVVVSGCTDQFQPWTYDPRPGHPYNAFIVERLYDHFFDTHAPRARENGLSYDGLVTLIYEERARLRAEADWQTEAWEEAVVHHYQRAMHRLTKLSSDHGVAIVAALQPVVMRKRHLAEPEREVASGEFLAYLDRQYVRLEAFYADLAARRPFRRTFTAVDLGSIFRDREAATFTDIVHYDDAGREIVARRLAAEVSAALARARRRGFRGRAHQALTRIGLGRRGVAQA